MIRIITDSAADFTAEEAAKNNLIVLPMQVTFGETSYRDGVDLSSKEFYEKLIESDELPVTSQIPPMDFEIAYNDITKKGDEAIVITLSSEVSGTYQNAYLTSRDYENIHVVDSLNVTVGEQCLVKSALRLIEEGKSAIEIAMELEEIKKSIKVIALLDTLEYLKKGGRISASTAFVGGMLSIKPVVEIIEGKVEVVGKARGSKNGNNLLMELVKKAGGIDFSKPLVLGYSGLNRELLDKYIEDSRLIWEGKTDYLETAYIGPTIGTHAGPGVVAIGFTGVNE